MINNAFDMSCKEETMSCETSLRKEIKMSWQYLLNKQTVMSEHSSMFNVPFLVRPC